MFSAFERSKILAALSEEEYDLLVIGGGITGAGIALDATLRGLKVALVEKQDFAAGTSSRSTKLIHGGLRYLKQLDFGLVKEVGQERAILHRNAPHLVHPEKMLLPIVKGGSLGLKTTAWALWLYDRLAKVEDHERRQMLTVTETTNAISALKTESLKGGALYWEYRTDDARLTIEVLKSAAEKGATLLNYCRFSSFHYNPAGYVDGGVLTDEKAGETIDFRAKMVVNAAGPWVDETRLKDGRLQDKSLFLTKGIHLVFDHEKLPVEHPVYFDVGDGRMIFAIPRQGCTYVGTTDTEFHLRPERPKISKKDARYLLDAVNRMFDVPKLRLEDVRSSWAGIRPLIAKQGKSPSELSRKDEIFISDNGLISIAGGKLTGYRKMAERVCDLVCKKLKIQADSTTENAILSGGHQTQPEENWPTWLFRRYGSNTGAVLEFARSKDSSTSELLKAELEYCVKHEMVLELSDFLIRRTGSLYFNRAETLPLMEGLNQQLAELLGWDEQQAKESLENCKNEFEDVLNFT